MEDAGPRFFASLSFRGELKHGAHLGEGGRGPHHGDEGGLLVEVLAETDDDDVDELRVADRVAEFAKLVTDSLDALAEEIHRGIALGHVAKLGVRRVFLSVVVALKELTEGAPDVGGGGAIVI